MFDGKFHPLSLLQGLLIANIWKIQNKLPNNSSEHQSRVKATVDNRNIVHFYMSEIIADIRYRRSSTSSMTASQSICIGDHRRTSSGKGGGDIGEDGMGDEHLVGDTAGNADMGNGGTGSLLIFGVGEGGMK